MKICLIVYKIDPVAGSENASGYHLAKEISTQYPDTTIISRTDHIKKLKQDPHFASLNLIGLDVPKVFSFYKKGNRGIILYYYLWQITVGQWIKKQTFDVIHQINFHADWAPHFIDNPESKMIWGPIAHHPATPLSWLRYSSWSDYFKELTNRFVKNILWHINPYLYKAIKRADHIFFSHTDWPYPFRRKHHKIALQTYAGCHWPISAQSKSSDFSLLFVGRFVALKGPHVAMEAFARFLNITQSKARMTFIGEGPLNDYLSKKAADINAVHPHAVTILPWQGRDDLIKFYQRAHFMLYPSIEAQGLVVSEAISQSCPVITLNDTGPAFIAQHPALTVQCSDRSYSRCVDQFSQKIIELFQEYQSNPDKYSELQHLTTERAHDLRWDVIAKKLMLAYGKHHD